MVYLEENIINLPRKEITDNFKHWQDGFSYDAKGFFNIQKKNLK